MAQTIPSDTKAVNTSNTTKVSTENSTKSTNAAWALLGVLNDLNDQINQFQTSQIQVSTALAGIQGKFSEEILEKATDLISFNMKGNWVKITGTILTAVSVAALTIGTGGAALPIAAGVLGACLDIAAQGMNIHATGITKDIQELRAGSQNTGTTSRRLSDSLKQSFENQASIKEAGYQARRNMNSSHYIN